jgi:hypothetical protein
MPTTPRPSWRPDVADSAPGAQFRRLDHRRDLAYAFSDPQGVIIDGPSIALPSNTILSRTSCDAPAGAAASWTSKPASASNGTPGTGPLSTGQDRICITEIADSNRQQFEYVEIFVE